MKLKSRGHALTSSFKKQENRTIRRKSHGVSVLFYDFKGIVIDLLSAGYQTPNHLLGQFDREICPYIDNCCGKTLPSLLLQSSSFLSSLDFSRNDKILAVTEEYLFCQLGTNLGRNEWTTAPLE
jgi:hypothetical protein